MDATESTRSRHWYLGEGSRVKQEGPQLPAAPPHPGSWQGQPATARCVLSWGAHGARGCQAPARQPQAVRASPGRLGSWGRLGVLRLRPRAAWAPGAGGTSLGPRLLTAPDWKPRAQRGQGPRRDR